MKITEKREKEVSARIEKLNQEISKVCQLVENKIEEIPGDCFNFSGHDILYINMTKEKLGIRLNYELVVDLKLEFTESFHDVYTALGKQLDTLFEDCGSKNEEWQKEEGIVSKRLVF